MFHLRLDQCIMKIIKVTSLLESRKFKAILIAVRGPSANQIHTTLECTVQSPFPEECESRTVEGICSSVCECVQIKAYLSVNALLISLQTFCFQIHACTIILGTVHFNITKKCCISLIYIQCTVLHWKVCICHFDDSVLKQFFFT